VLLICPVRPGDSNEELRFALRSWETNLHLGTPLQLMTVGDCPSWLEPDWHYKGNDFKSMPLAVFANIKWGAAKAADKGFDECLFMNDDFFCMDPVGAVLPVKRNVTLAEHIAIFPQGAGNWWPLSLRLTASWLAEEGFPHPDSYEVHRPLPARPSEMFEALSRWDWERTYAEGTVPQWRTVYGTLNKVDAFPVVDATLNSAKAKGVGTPWLSTTDQSWRFFATEFKRRFQKPSRWEK